MMRKYLHHTPTLILTLILILTQCSEEAIELPEPSSPNTLQEVLKLPEVKASWSKQHQLMSDTTISLRDRLVQRQELMDELLELINTYCEEEIDFKKLTETLLQTRKGKNPEAGQTH